MEPNADNQQIHKQRGRAQEPEQSTTTLKQELTACLVRENGHVVALPTDELQAALDQVRTGRCPQGHHLSFNRDAVYAFLQTIKDAMQTCKALPPE